MKQTAVEWLMEIDKSRAITIEEWQQAKEMEKEQIRTILLAYNEERNDRTDGSENYWEPYEVDDFLEEYNKTFNINEK
jgi:hypothetical protein